MTGTEIIWAFNRLEVTPKGLAKSGNYFDDPLPDNVYEELGPITEVAQGGGEGQGEDWYTVFKFENHDVYIRVDAFYSSYDGVDFYNSEFNVVTPQERTITVYE